jgi:hypothetical protein
LYYLAFSEVVVVVVSTLSGLRSAFMARLIVVIATVAPTPFACEGRIGGGGGAYYIALIFVKGPRECTGIGQVEDCAQRSAANTRNHSFGLRQAAKHGHVGAAHSEL